MIQYVFGIRSMRQTIKEFETTVPLTRAYVKHSCEKNGKKTFPHEKFEKEEWKEIKESTTDPESGYYVKDERTKQFAYSFHAVTDEHGFKMCNFEKRIDKRDRETIFQSLLSTI